MSIIIKPIITEKVTKDGELFNRFGFVVDKKSQQSTDQESCRGCLWRYRC